MFRDLCQVQGKAALVAANVECAVCGAEPLRPFARGGIVRPLIEKGACLLAGVGVVLEGEAIEAELRGRDCSRLSN